MILTRHRAPRLAAPFVVGAIAFASLSAQTVPPTGVQAFTNARVITADGPRAFTAEDVVILVRDGKVVDVGPSSRVRPPAGARITDLGGKFVIPGLISAHAHVSDVQGLKPRAYTAENTRRQLGVFARYGVTSVWSLGGEQAPAFALRDAQATPGLDRARLFVAGEIVTATTPDQARQAVARVAGLAPDVIKIRVDDNLGTATKMPPAVYRAVIDEAHRRGLRVAAHIFYLDDAKDLLRAGVDMIAHSVRDKDLDEETVALMKARNVPYCPTLTREVSTFGYESTPAFFADPFFQKEADREVVLQLQEPARQQAMRASTTAQRYKAGLAVAMRNVKRASDAGVLVAMGTDSGAFPERFQGFFEHLEMEMMAEAGMTPAAILRAATVDAARAMSQMSIGAIATGRWADFVVLDRNPLDDIRHTRSIASVWIAGAQIAR
jgi:imidazolonepropionase-like amidohydrolase